MADTFNMIWQDVFRNAPTLSQEAVLEVLDEMDVLLEDAVTAILPSRVVISQALQQSASVVGSLSHGRGIFERMAFQLGDQVTLMSEHKNVIARTGVVTGWPKDPSKKMWPITWEDDTKEIVELRLLKKIVQDNNRDKKHGVRGIVWDCDPGKVYRFKNKPDYDAIQYISATIRLYAAWQAGSATKEHLKALQLSRASYEAILEAFFLKTKGYRDLCIKGAALRQDLNKQQNGVDALVRVSACSEAMLACEIAVGIGDELFGTIAILESMWRRYCELRNKIYIPYLRVVFDEAKKRATSEIQTIQNFQNGAEGLLSAVSKYNRKRGVFSSYARQWAMQGILLRLKEESNAIKLPPAVWQTANLLNEIAHRHASMTPDGSYDLAEVAREAGLDEQRAEKILERIRSTQMLSIDYQPDDPDAQSLHETIEAGTPDEIPSIDHYIERLGKKQKFCLFLNHGLFDRLPGNTPSDPVAIARERLRQNIAATVNDKRPR